MQHSLRQRLNAHAKQHWPQLAGVTVRYRAGFAYVTGELTDQEPLSLCRLRFTGVLHTWGFALHFDLLGSGVAGLDAELVAAVVEDQLVAQSAGGELEVLGGGVVVGAVASAVSGRVPAPVQVGKDAQGVGARGGFRRCRKESASPTRRRAVSSAATAHATPD